MLKYQTLGRFRKEYCWSVPDYPSNAYRNPSSPDFVTGHCWFI